MQLKKSHAVPPVQAPLTHTLGEVHALQAAPAVPQLAADWLTYGTHRFPEQQPMGQVLALQVPLEVHWPMVQLVPEPQL